MSFTEARNLALYAVCLVPLWSALAAWERGWTLVAWGAFFAVALGLAVRGADRLAERVATLELPGSGRSRALGASLYFAGASLSLLALLGVGTPRVASALAWLFATLSPLLVLASGLTGSLVPPLANSLVLCVIAAAGGGWPAALAALSFAAALPLLLAFDHHARTLLAFPTRRTSLVGGAARRAAEVASPALAFAAALLAFLPPQPYLRPSGEGLAAVRPAALGPGQGVLLVVAFGAMGLSLASRLLRSKREERTPPIDPELVEVEALEDEALADADAVAPCGGARGRIVRAYVGALSLCARAGWKRRVGQTPAEFLAQARLRGLEALTALFARARYGPDEPNEAEAREAEAMARVLAGGLEPRRPRAP